MSEVALHQERTAANSAGPGVADPAIALPEITAGRGPRDPVWHDAQCLVKIARRHAALALASPAELRASRLDACRLVWIRYAAAFGAKPAMQVRFADELQDVTRILMAAQQKSDGAPPETGAERRPAPPPDATTTIITIEELRPLLQQIIRQ